MSDRKKTKAQLIEELQRLRVRLSDEKSSASSRYQAIFESATEGILFADISTMDKRRREEFLEELRENGSVTGFESQTIRKNGTNTWVSANATVSRNDNGDIEYIDGTEEDITELKLVREALCESEERYRQIVEASPFGMHMYRLEPDGRLVFEGANPAADWILRIDHARLKEKTIEEAFPSLVGTDVPEQYRKIARRGERWRTENIAYEDGVIKGTFEVVAFQRSPMKMAAVFKDITERKRAEEKLRESEERFRRIFDEGPLGMVTVNSEYCFTTANDSFCRMLGYSEQELLSLTFKDITHPDNLASDIESIGKLARGEIPVYHTEKQYIRKDGRPIWGALTTCIIRNAEGRFLYFLSMVDDITERKRAEEALRTAEEQYRLLFEGAGEGILVAQDGKVVLCNPAWTTMSGYDPEEHCLQSVTEFIHPEDREFVLDRHQRRMRGENVPTGYDFRIVTKKGETRITRINSSMIMWQDRPASLNFLADVTERRQAEDETRKFKTISDNAIYGSVVSAPDGTLLYVNKAMAQMHGYSPEEVVGDHVSVFHSEQQMDPVRIVIKEMLKTGGLPPIELWHRRRDGTEFSTLTSGTTIYDAAGQPQFLSAAVIDTSELKRLQELADRAHRLEAAGRIAGQVAHDFNNLLGPLVAYPGIIREELGDDHPVFAYLEPIEVAAKQMADINQQLLTLGRRGHYVLEPLNLNEVIRQMLKQIQAQHTNVEVVADLAANLMNISGGVAQILRVMTNLITNAVDAMKGIGTLTITSENWYAEETKGKYGLIARGEYARVTISDTGCGIPDDVMPHVFEPFFTTKKTDRKRGSGLGLSVVHAVVEDHHGHVDIDSVVGQGTSIYLYFPITREEILWNDEAIVRGSDESVLIVDDDATQREVTLRLLQKLGYRAVAVDCGETALERLKSESFDLLILDMVMPGGHDGAYTYSLAKELHPDQKAILVSGFAESDRVSEALRIGAGDFIKKPLTLRSLATAVRRELDRERVTETVG